MHFPDQPADLYQYQRIAEEAGFLLCAGVDEAGRGPLAGPVTAAAVILPLSFKHPALNDSKQVSEKIREELFDVLMSTPEVIWHITEISPERIDEINILRATHEAMQTAVSNLKTTPDLVLVDGNPVSGFPCPAKNIIKGDAKCAAISAASILAKVHRDRRMADYHKEFPEYGFARHKGYGTKAHLEALREYGPCAIHRKSFAPVAELLNEGRQGQLF